MGRCMNHQRLHRANSYIRVRNERTGIKLKNKKHHFIACETVLNEMLPYMPAGSSYEAIEPGLHLQPKKLKAVLQDAIDAVTSAADFIILGYGLCSMAVIDLQAAESTLVVPRSDDCIALLLGSQENYRKHLNQEPGTYFLSKGWIESGINIVEEHRQIEERHGKDYAKMVKEMMFKNYTRLALINLGYQNEEHYRQFSRRAAKELDLRFEEIEGTTRLLKKMITGPWDSDFVVAVPGHKISLADFGMK